MAEDKNTKSKIAEREEEILKFWQENKIFEKSLEKLSPKGNFVFYDGPPFATGTPHYGHILPGTIKDVIPRYQTMKGKKVARRWGWDCHGLPIENLVEKELGLSSKRILKFWGWENSIKQREIWLCVMLMSGKKLFHESADGWIWKMITKPWTLPILNRFGGPSKICMTKV